MKYQSTRGGMRDVSFEKTLFSGYSPDGGLYVPQAIPQLATQTLQQWAPLSYVQLAQEIIAMFVPEMEVPREELKCIIDNAFSRIKHPGKVEVRRLGNGLNVLEMFYGPTLAFKDYSLCVVGALMEYFISKRGGHTTIIVGTSGDTGSAAIEAVKGRKHIDIVVYLPHKRCTNLQELQMTTVLDQNVHVFSVDGSNDEIQEPIDHCLKDNDFASKHNLCSINSTNWGRVLVQCVHYFYAYFQVVKAVGDLVEIVVPSGAAGNLSGGVLAYKMGLPIKLVATNNVNAVLARTITQGDYSKHPCIRTMAVSMDIQLCYNIERLVYMLTEYDVMAASDLMDQYTTNNDNATIPPKILKMIQTVITATVCSDDVIEKTMTRCFHDDGYLVCPHTATAIAYHYSCIDSPLSDDQAPPRVCIVTASPDKFPEALRRVGLSPRSHPTIDALPSLPTRVTHLGRGDDWEARLREEVENIARLV